MTDKNDVDKKESDIQLNMLKPKAAKLPEITESQFNNCNRENVDMVNEFLRTNRQLAPETKTQYYTCLKQFFYYIKENSNDKPFYNISKRDFIQYLAYMQDRGLSSSAINLRKSACSSFCNYIENIVAYDMPECKNFKNFTRGMPQITKTQVYDKIPISNEEYKLIMKTLEKNQDYLGMAWVATAFHIGCRRSELIQFRTEILDYPLNNKNYVLSHVVRGKGSGIDGKPLKYMIPIEVLKYWKLWIEHRPYQSEYIFTTYHEGKTEHMSRTWANVFCQTVLSKICGRRINPHLFKASCVTHLLEQGKDMKLVSKYIAKHSDISTTSQYYDLRTFEDEIDNLFDLEE